MAIAGALHAGSRILLPIRRSPSSSAPWSHVRAHLHSSKPSSAPLPPTPPPPPPPCSPALSSRFIPAFAPTTRRSGSIGSGVVAWYLGSIEARPVLTKSITAAAIFTVADLTSQMITLPPEESLDLTRTLRMASYGMLLSGPSLHFWFNFLSKAVPKKDLLNTFKKMFLGQAVYGPIINCVFFSYNAGLQGETIPEIIARLKRDIIPTIKSGLIYWPFCDFITFKFIPVHLQPLVSNSFSFLWTIYITYMASLKKPEIEGSQAHSNIRMTSV
ncbi:PXMP2/4 family protein 4-like [Lolium rigidum]|uniref:PXMP2/4 family protein 4-like n=1 Tax=Lolium rigidum TaxID=89674 RepID=UPI001F5D7254|nr:PXMP2/4 family protein 4-like [Lolium rigidum]